MSKKKWLIIAVVTAAIAAMVVLPLGYGQCGVISGGGSCVM